MDKTLRAGLLIILIIIPLVFYKALDKRHNRREIVLPIVNHEFNQKNTKIALIFEGFGNDLDDLKEIYSLGIPLSVSVTPGLKFSKNIAHIASRCGYSVLVNLPVGSPTNNALLKESIYSELDDSLTIWETEALLRYYLNAIRIAVGVNAYINPDVADNTQFTQKVLDAVKVRGLIFIDNSTPEDSAVYEMARAKNLKCAVSYGFLGNADTLPIIEEKIKRFVAAAKDKGKIIIVVYPEKNVLKVLRKDMPELLEKVDFITVKEYFEP